MNQPISGQRNIVITIRDGEITGMSGIATPVPQSQDGSLAKLAYTVDEAAAVAGFSKGYIYQRIKAGDLTARRSGTKKVVIYHADLDAWLRNLPVAAKGEM